MRKSLPADPGVAWTVIFKPARCNRGAGKSDAAKMVRLAPWASMACRPSSTGGIRLGLFSLFGKRDAAPATTRPTGRGGKSRPAGVKRTTVESTSQKIDSIEYEMAAEFMPPPTAPVISRGSNVNPAAPAPPRPRLDALTLGAAVTRTNPVTMFGGDSIAKTIAMSASEAAPAIDEAAILFALGEMASVEILLKHAIDHLAHGDNDNRIAWAMLLDLYQVIGQRAQFDDLSIAYAHAFETSPPAWIDFPHAAPRLLQQAGKIPAIAFAGKLDSHILPQLGQLQALAAEKPTVRLEFTRVTEVDPVGCEMLLAVLHQLQTPEHELVLVGSQELMGKIRQIIQVGRRDERRAPWLLLLEILRLLNLEQEFEECSIEYCVTLEVSPPAFIAPHNKVTTALPGTTDLQDAESAFMMPAVIVERSEPLLVAMQAFVISHDPAILDCAHLVRIDFNSANQLMSRLQPLAAQGRSIRLEHVNHLVAALFRVIGLHEILQIGLRKV